jgi:hypothetical protein
MKNLILPSEYLLKEYLLSAKTFQDIATEKGITKGAVSYWLKYYEIPVRSNIEVLKKKINSSFFSKLTSDSAFLLGYFFTDGDLQFNIKSKEFFVRLYSKQKENLEMVLMLLKSDAKIQHRKAVMTEKIRQGELYFIHIADETFIADLISHGMVRNKNSKITFPKIPDNLVNHFIRGCWAGSGCIYSGKNGSITSRFVTGSKDLILSIESKLNNAGLKKRKIYSHKHTKSPSYYITYAREESMKLYRYLYAGADSRNVVKHQTEEFVSVFNLRML